MQNRGKAVGMQWVGTEGDERTGAHQKAERAEGSNTAKADGP